MARIAVISDIHGNLEALEAVLRAIEGHQVDHLVHLGDLVGYNASPRECVELLRENNAISVLGNHDMALLEPKFAHNFNVMAFQALHYSISQLTRVEKRYLQGLSRSEVLWDRYLICHGTPESVESYILNLFQAKRAFNLLRKHYGGVRVCFFGHTHVQTAWIYDPRGKVISLDDTNGELHLESDHLYLVNPGSVGQPRQRDNRAHYLLFDTEREVVAFRAVPYDIERAQSKILKAKLPQYLANRLQDGI
ncbi:MAG: metallophosphoesterase [Syntrophobacteraceae bacterium]